MPRMKTLYERQMELATTLQPVAQEPPKLKIGHTPIEIALGIDEQGRTTAKKLYSFLELNQSNYSKWCKRNITENDFAEENVDYFYSSSSTSERSRGNFAQDYILVATFAKKLAMTSNSVRGEQAREYFIKVEEQLKKIAIAMQSHAVQTVPQLATLDEIINLTEEQARIRYNIGRTNLKEIANYIGANVRVGKKRLYNRRALDEYFNKPDIQFERQ